jgi:hypothetical protein
MVVRVGAVVVGGLLGLAAGLALQAWRRWRWRRLGGALHDRHRAFWTQPVRWVAVEGDDLEPWREPAAAAIAAELQALGFCRAGYLETTHGPPAGAEQRLLTVSLAAAGDIHVASREQDGRELLELETELTDGRVLTTDNFPGPGLLAPPPAIEVLHRPGATAAALLHEHRQRLQDRLAPSPGVAIISMSSIADVIASQERQQALHRRFRAELDFVSDQEWEPIADTLRLSREARRAVLAAYRSRAASARAEPRGS